MAKLHSQHRAGLSRARARFLTQSMQLEETEAPGVIGGGLILSGVLIIGAIVWANVTEVSELARTAGEVIPSGTVRQVQHLEGGIVGDVMVRNGQRVNAGETLVTLAAANATSEFNEQLARLTGLRLRRERLQALLEQREPAFTSVEAPAEAIALQQEVYAEQQQSLARQLGLIRAEADQARTEVDTRARQAAAIAEEVALLKAKRNMRNELLTRHAIARVDTLDAALELAERNSQLTQAQGAWATAKKALQTAYRRETEAIARRREGWSLEFEQVGAQIDEMNQRMDRLRDRTDRLQLVSPVEGIVKGLAVHAPGEIIESGKTVMEIVPIDETLIVESRIQPKDVGHVQPGQEVDVKVTSFEPQRFGSITGTLIRVSASTYLDQQQMPYYRAEIALNKSYVGEDPALNAVLPGMTVSADIVTGTKSVLDYILRPVYRGLHGAMRER